MSAIKIGGTERLLRDADAGELFGSARFRRPLHLERVRRLSSWL
jgi:hypothetical protein